MWSIFVDPLWLLYALLYFFFLIGQALESLRKFPLALNSGFECIILEHFDKQLCLKLSHKLDEYEAISKYNSKF